MGNGETIRFWEDTWLGNLPLQQQYPLLYNLVQQKNATVHDVLHGAPPLNISYRRDLLGHRWDEWSHLCLRLMDINLSDQPDSFVWKLTQNGIFSVKSMYEDMMNGHTRFFKNLLVEIENTT